MLMCFEILKAVLIVVTVVGVLLLLSLAVRALVWIADVFIDWLLMRE